MSFLVCGIGDFRNLDSQQRKIHGFLMIKNKHLILPLATAVLFFISCDNEFVSRTEYKAALSRADSLEAQNDSLQFELSDLKLYNEYLEKALDTLEHQR